MCEWLLLSTIGVVLVPTLPVAKHLPFASLALDVPRPGGRARRHMRRPNRLVLFSNVLVDKSQGFRFAQPQGKVPSKRATHADETVGCVSGFNLPGGRAGDVLHP